MEEKQNKINRRNFLKAVAAGSLGSAALCGGAVAGPNDPNAPRPEKKTRYPQVPRRKLGKTGIDVPCLALGFGAVSDPIVLRRALDWGVNHWDTSLVAAGGNSEISIGEFIGKNPELRKDIFIVTKESDSKSAEDLEKCLQTSLKRLKTDYVDLYFGVYRMSEPAQLTDETKAWAQSAKERKLIRFFGFSTHKNIPLCLNAAAKLDWIDAIQHSYNFRLMADPEIQSAVDACHKAGIGLIAMKTQARRSEPGPDDAITRQFLKKGFTEGQAKIKAVLQDKRISAACVAMQNVALLTSNVAAVLDKTKLSTADIETLNAYARVTCSGYCAGCAEICDAALAEAPYVSDIMRCLMYHDSYGQKESAKQLFAQIPSDVRGRLLSIDYAAAEERCPQRMPIAKLIAEAVTKLA